MEWFVEKATEIGVHAITPIICQRSERKVVKRERLHKIAIAAMKQSLGAYLPMIHPFCDFFTALKQLEGKAFIAHCEDTEKVILDSQVLAHKSISIFIGPEGDFSTEEIKAAADENVTAITFGTKRMRTETAGIIACHSVSQLYMKNLSLGYESKELTKAIVKAFLIIVLLIGLFEVIVSIQSLFSHYNCSSRVAHWATYNTAFKEN